MELSEVSFGYPGKDPLFERVDLAIDEGAYCLVEGPSGAGKSTLLRLLNRLEEPSGGTITFRGRQLTGMDPAVLRREVSMIQQTPTVVDACVRDNLMMPFCFRANRDLDRPSDGELRASLDRFLLEGVGLDDNALELSVGQRQRLCFIRALLLKPTVLLLDEPTASLDDKSAGIVENAAMELNLNDGLTVLNVSHRNAGAAFTDSVTVRVEGGGVAVHED